MRIRKHAARILSSLSSVPTRPQSAAAAAAAANREAGMHVCKLNQLPWDAMAFMPPRGAPLYCYQVLEELEEVGDDYGYCWGATRSGQTAEEPDAEVSNVSGITTAESTLRRKNIKTEAMAGAAGDEEKRVRERDAKKSDTHPNDTTNTEKTMRKIATSRAMAGEDGNEKVKMEVGSSPTASAASRTTCKKSDGKGWHCEREAQRPHSLCEYHLVQVRSYYSNGVSTGDHVLQQQQQSLPKKAQNAPLIPNRKNNLKKKATTKKGNSGHGDKSSVGRDCAAAGRTRRTPPSDLFYYYLGFGPWRGKQRSGAEGGGGDRGTCCNADAGDGDDEGDGVCHGAPPLLGHDQAPDDLDDDDDDPDREYEGDDVVASRKRGRKPVKARSLKSLL